MSKADRAPVQHAKVSAALQETAGELERILRAQLEGHQRLLACLERKRQAIRDANVDAVNAACGDEAALAETMASLDRRRVVVISLMTRAIDASERDPLPLNALLPRLDSLVAQRLTALAAQLRDSIEQVQRTSSIIRTAADALSRHMSGIVQSVQTALSKARVYSPRGRIESGSQLRFCVDLKS